MILHKPNNFLIREILLHPMILIKPNKFPTQNILLHAMILIKPNKFLTQEILLHAMILIKPNKFPTRNILLHPIILIKRNKFLTRNILLHTMIFINKFLIRDNTLHCLAKALSTICRFYLTLTNFLLETPHYTARQIPRPLYPPYSATDMLRIVLRLSLLFILKIL